MTSTEPGTVESVRLFAEDGSSTVKILRADPWVFFTDEFLADADPAFLEQGEGLVRICRTLVYRLDHHYQDREMVPEFYTAGPGWTAHLISTIPVRA